MTSLALVGGELPISVYLSNGEVIGHKGAATIIDGHLYLLDDRYSTPPKIFAIYAPAVWKSVIAGPGN